jgi:hypothetical protein
MHPELFPRPVRIASVKKLRETWDESPLSHRRGGAAGVDDISPSQFRGELDRNIRDIHSRIQDSTYEFRPLRPLPIPKTNGGIRLICIPTVEDRLVQRLIVDYLLAGDKLSIKNNVSYGFVKYRGGVPKAVTAARNLRSEYPWVFKSDISSFFDCIDREELKSNLARQLRHSSITPLLFAAIDCEIDESDKRLTADVKKTGVVRRRGLRQGMPISPMLSNFVLREFDKFFERHGARLIRYADDFVLFAKTEAECLAYFQMVREQLLKKKHTIPDLYEGSKTLIRRPEEPIEFLGLEITLRVNGSGYRIQAPQAAFESIKKTLDGFADFDYCASNHKSLFKVVTKINRSVSGFTNVYRLAKNFHDLQSHAENCRQDTFRRLLKNIFGSDVVSGLDQRRLNFLEISGLFSNPHD